MREIKFRAWDNKAKKWLLGYEHSNLGGFSMFGEMMLFNEWSSVVNRFILQQTDRKPEDLILMQFTGLYDKNGKEIYEGDILKYTAHNGYGLFPGRLTVRWIAESGCFGYSHSDQSFRHNYISPFTEHDELQYDVLNYCEIIGNIYETPDLIK